MKCSRNFSFEEVKENLISFVKDSAYAPKLADLVQKSPNMIPGLVETKKIIKPKHVPAQESVIQRELANMRMILGIVR
jgi:hypothetical protein